MTSIPDTIFFQIAGFNIRINFNDTIWILVKKELKKEIIKYLQEFILKEKPLYIHHFIEFLREEHPKILLFKKDKESYINICKNVSKNKTLCFYYISLAIFEKVLANIISELLINNNGFILHASAVKVNNKAVIFMGESGAGKSTIRLLLYPKLASLSDDKAIIKRQNKVDYYYQTPFIEKSNKIKKNPTNYPIDRIFFLRKSKSLRVKSLSNNEQIIALFLKQFQTNEKYSANIIDFVNKFNKFHYLYFSKNKAQLINFLGLVK